MKKIILLTLVLIFVRISTPTAVSADNIDNPQIYSQPIIKWGNSSYHDSLGARDPYVVKDQGTYYLYFDCTEDLLNPSFESNLGTNGWDTWEGTAVSTNEKHLFGDRSLKVTNLGTVGGGAYTGNYYFGDKIEANLAMPSGLEVTPNTTYIASAYVWAGQNSIPKFIIQQYKDDPLFYFQNLVLPTATHQVTGNNDWQRVFIKFTTTTNTSAITISLVSDLNQTSYWDGVQLERVEASVNNPSPFPTDQSYNYNLEDTVGWRSCLATSIDGTNFQKKGQIPIVGIRGDWETKEKPGWVGSSGMYLSPFFYQGFWYSYTWVAGYRLGTDSYTQDQGSQYRRKWYGDRRAFLPNGNPSRSGLIRSTSLLGPFERVSQAGPQVLPNLSTGWGQTYVTANGVPQRINNQWVLFLAGTPGNIFNWRTITPGLAIGDSPLGPWTVTDYSPLLPPDNNNEVPEGPIYYPDRSGTHFLFINDISAGSVVVHWTANPLAAWLPANKKTIIDQSNVLWSKGPMGLSSVVEKDDDTILLYFATRPSTDSPPNGWNQYLFHDIGLATFSLPLKTVIPGDLNGDGHVNIDDYNILVKIFGNPYTIFDYNVLVGNFGH